MAPSSFFSSSAGRAFRMVPRVFDNGSECGTLELSVLRKLPCPRIPKKIPWTDVVLSHAARR